MAGVAAAAHLVQFYSGAERLAESLSSLYAEPLMRGETVVVVARSEHRDALDVALADAGVNLRAEYRSGRYLPVDAEQALSAFMTPAGPDADLFRSTVATTVLGARYRTGSVHAYGEMVGVLAARGDLVAALALEALWERALAEHPFRLMCGYPRDVVGELTSTFDTICGAHEAVVVSRRATEPALVANVDLPLGPDAAATARRAAREVLSAWGVADAAGLVDASLVVSELVAAASRHGATRVTLGLGLDDEQVVVSVTDGDVTTPPHPAEGDLATTGRSFSLLTMLAQAWGVETLSHGTRLWARLPATRPAVVSERR
jgi:hypothetical protein